MAQAACAGTHLVELLELVDAVVADQRLPDEQREVGLVERHQLGERAHQRLVVLHAPRRVHQHHVGIHLRLGGVPHRLLRDARRILAVALVEDLNAERAGVHLELLDRAGTEGVARRDQHLHVVPQQPVADLGEARGLAHAVDAAEHDDERPPLLPHVVDLPHNVERLLRRQDPRELRLERRLDRALDPRP